MQDSDMVWYFAFGSNMASTTMERRQLSPRDSRPVLVPSHVLCFDVFGVPYMEPAMAGIRERTPADDAEATPPKTNHALGKLECLMKTLQQIDTIHLLVETFSEYFGAVNSSKDIETIFKSGRIASLIGVEGLHQIADSSSVVRLFHKLGVRYITLCHDGDNLYADSSNG
ncbi:hypothetical protein FVER53590_13317 [Fusarium verticillioides]|nr:hypothetical protein FVER53590_13317 [Fusarium verticillioides]